MLRGYNDDTNSLGENMEAVRIGEHKLKLSLSVAEAEKYRIS
jgi:hypothetical protein